MNALSPASLFDVAAERFDTLVARAFASTKATRHMRDRLIGQVHAGVFDHLLLRAGAGMPTLPEALERRAALNTIDFAFEPLVVPGLSVAQALAYLQAVETSLTVCEASGLDAPGPYWIDTVHHACVFSVLFQLAAHLRCARGCDRVVLLHEGRRPEPRLAVVRNLLRQVHGMALLCLPLQGRWFQELAKVTTPTSAVFYLTDMPDAVVGGGKPAAPRRAQIDLYAPPGIYRPVDTVSGSQVLARRLGATHCVLDYPMNDRIRIRPFQADQSPACPLEDWVFWPVLAASQARPGVTQLTA